MSEYKVKKGTENLVHVRFTKILKGKGKRTYDVQKDQVFYPKEFEAFKKTIEKYGLAAITQQDEFEILHDPRVNGVDNSAIEIAEIKQYLTEQGVEFDSRLGLTKLRTLKKDTEDKLNKEK